MQNIEFPFWLFIIDYCLGFVMWLMILRFSLNLLFQDDTNVRLIKLFFLLTNKIIKFFSKLIPSILPNQLISIYLSWLLFMIRFYFLPLTKGFEAIGYLSFPFENFMIDILYQNILSNLV